MSVNCTHTYAVLEVSREAFMEIACKLAVADYEHAFHCGSDGRSVIDMHGIAITPTPRKHALHNTKSRSRKSSSQLPARSKSKSDDARKGRRSGKIAPRD